MVGFLVVHGLLHVLASDLAGDVLIFLRHVQPRHVRRPDAVGLAGLQAALFLIIRPAVHVVAHRGHIVHPYLVGGLLVGHEDDAVVPQARSVADLHRLIRLGIVGPQPIDLRHREGEVLVRKAGLTLLFWRFILVAVRHPVLHHHGIELIGVADRDLLVLIADIAHHLLGGGGQALDLRHGNGDLRADGLGFGHILGLLRLVACRHFKVYRDAVTILRIGDGLGLVRLADVSLDLVLIGGQTFKLRRLDRIRRPRYADGSAAGWSGEALRDLIVHQHGVLVSVIGHGKGLVCIADLAGDALLIRNETVDVRGLEVILRSGRAGLVLILGLFALVARGHHILHLRHIVDGRIFHGDGLVRFAEVAVHGVLLGLEALHLR